MSGKITIKPKYKSVLRVSHRRIITKKCDLYGNHNDVFGNGNLIIGDYCKIYGKNNTIIGNHNIIMGDYNNVDGDYNKMTGIGCESQGEHNTYNGSLTAKKEIPLPPIDFVDQESPDSCVICLTNKKCCTSMPCRHLCLCAKCSHELVHGSDYKTNPKLQDVIKCPICRQDIEEIMLLFS
jgi:hypothetical protein